MSDAIICTLWICQCGHLESEHDWDDGCQDIVDVNDLGAELCPCTAFVRATVEAQP